MDGAAFVGQEAAKAGQAQAIEHTAGQAFIKVMGRLGTPGVEAPADPGQALLRVADEAWTGVAAPAVVDGDFDQLDVGPAQRPGLADRAGVDHHLHRLEAGDGVGDPGEIDLHIRQGHAPGRLPQGLVVRPDHPGGGVSGPFGGHEPAVVVGAVVVHCNNLQLSNCFQRCCLGVHAITGLCT
ncbi:hypothetical protein D9M71_587470 [compost metagenome]